MAATQGGVSLQPRPWGSENLRCRKVAIDKRPQGPKKETLLKWWFCLVLFCFQWEHKVLLTIAPHLFIHQTLNKFCGQILCWAIGKIKDIPDLFMPKLPPLRSNHLRTFPKALTTQRQSPTLTTAGSGALRGCVIT